MISKNADKLPNMHNTEFHGLPVVIQWPKGSIRVGTRPDGSTFRTEMKADYGYVPQTEAAGDTENLDVYIGLDKDAEYAYAIEQLTDEGEFDEWKVMLGFSSLEDAEAMYLAHNQPGWEEDHVGDIEEIPFDYLFDMVERNQEEVSKTAGSHTLIEAFVKNYEHEVDFYQEVASLVQDKLDTALQDAGIKAVVSSRAKRPSRLEKKIEKRAPEKEYKTFRDIADDIVDLAGCRVALYMPADRPRVGQIIDDLFTQVRETKHFPKDRGPGDSLGYVADHYLVKLKPETLRRKELRYADTQVEIQVASVLMHAWAEVTHDLIYKPEKGQLTHDELQILRDLNDLVQTGEKQLEKLQNAIEGRTSEDLRFDIVAALQRLAQPASLTMDEFRLQASKIAATAPVQQQAPAQQRTVPLIYMWAEGYSEPRIMQGGQSDHHLFNQPTKAYPQPIPKQYYDEAYRGYATVAQQAKTVTLQPSDNTLPYLKSVPQQVVQQFQKRFPGYEITTAKSQWASYIKARIAVFKAQKADALDDRLKAEFAKNPATAVTPSGQDDPYWYEAVQRVGGGRKWDELTKEEQTQVIALAQELKQKK